MGISLTEIQQSAGEFAANLLIKQMKDTKGRFTVSEVEIIKSSHILQSEFGREFVNGVVLGAILEYHDQLHKVLLEKGIDIGEMEP